VHARFFRGVRRQIEWTERLHRWRTHGLLLPATLSRRNVPLLLLGSFLLDCFLIPVDLMSGSRPLRGHRVCSMEGKLTGAWVKIVVTSVRARRRKILPSAYHRLFVEQAHDLGTDVLPVPQIGSNKPSVVAEAAIMEATNRPSASRLR
jgi:hypothetical protein